MISYYTPLLHSPKQIHPKQIPKQKRSRNRRPQANETLKITFPKQPSRKSPFPSKNDKTPSKPQTPSTGCHQTPSKAHANPKQSHFLKWQIQNIGKSPSKPQAKFTSLQANSRFQVAPKHLTSNPKQIWYLTWGCEAGVFQGNSPHLFLGNY